MGKYALEHYSPYETYIIRPLPLPEAPANPGRGQYHLVELNWSELEADRGEYDLVRLKEAIRSVHNPMLQITQIPPSWVRAEAEEGFAHLVRRVLSALKKDEIIGIIISSENDSKRVWDAYLEAAGDITLFAELKKDALLGYLKEKDCSFGILITCSEADWIDCCEKMAEYSLSDTWEKTPVLLLVKDEFPGPNIRRESLRWHAGLSNYPLDIGYDFTIRRVVYPQKVESKGGLPIRFWFVNKGSAPCYQDYQVKLCLESELERQEFVLKIDKKTWKLGDITHNEIISLPVLPEGEYTLSAGIFFSDGSPMGLDLVEEMKEGYYRLGKVTICSKTAMDLAHAWEDFYPEGYYPLEDPKVPD